MVAPEMMQCPEEFNPSDPITSYNECLDTEGERSPRCKCMEITVLDHFY